VVSTPFSLRAELTLIGESESGRSHTNASHCAGLHSSGGVSPAPSLGL